MSIEIRNTITMETSLDQQTSSLIAYFNLKSVFKISLKKIQDVRLYCKIYISVCS